MSNLDFEFWKWIFFCAYFSNLIFLFSSFFCRRVLWDFSNLTNVARETSMKGSFGRKCWVLWNLQTKTLLLKQVKVNWEIVFLWNNFWAKLKVYYLHFSWWYCICFGICDAALRFRLESYHRNHTSRGSWGFHCRYTEFLIFCPSSLLLNIFLAGLMLQSMQSMEPL